MPSDKRLKLRAANNSSSSSEYCRFSSAGCGAAACAVDFSLLTTLLVPTKGGSATVFAGSCFKICEVLGITGKPLTLPDATMSYVSLGIGGLNTRGTCGVVPFSM
eukprot:2668231-Rhodomonas_salina.1